jgi:hypothetical protein
VALATIAIVRDDVAVDAEEVAELSRRFGFEDYLFIAAGAARLAGDSTLARRLLEEGIGATLPDQSFRAARECAACSRVDLIGSLLESEVSLPAEVAARQGALAVAAEVGGDTRSAAPLYESAAESFGSLELRPDQAYALQGSGRCLMRSGRVGEGRERLVEARERWLDLGAPRRIAEIEGLITLAES